MTTVVDPGTTLTESVAALVRSDLTPIVSDIDRQGLYPEDFLRKLGAIGGLGAAVSVEYGGAGFGLGVQNDITTAVARECGSTAFLVWCQTACAGYLLNAPNQAVRDRYLRPIINGELFAGTGMSNAVKHLSGIERIHLKAVREGKGYVINGSLPWVSNIGPGHLAVVVAAIENEGYVMLAVHCDAHGVSLHDCPDFSGMEGTRTSNIRFKDALVGDDDVLAHAAQFDTYFQRIKPGFILAQTGMGFGIIEASLKTIRESNIVTAHVNQYLDDQEDDLAADYAQLRAHAHSVATQVHAGQAASLDVLNVRAATSELTLRAANSAILHAGAKGYLMRHPAQRRLREAVFVAIVTPALKHLRKEIHALQNTAKDTAHAEAA